ncbi:type VII secretion protein EccE [Mycolicibacterium palauense]|uniref:type VII secretion protein EccE n=1 Tax=Mycolicibacterium palauense TaxID=2034511 RepID=UPI000BFEE92A|nr:type VII secretion protein EccE [Mycolicibacterium palauense]
MAGPKRARGRWIRVPMISALVYGVAVWVTVAFTVNKALPVWAAATILVAAAIALFIPIRGRVLLVEWLAVAWSFLRQRRRPLPPELPPATDVNVISGTAGVRWDGKTLVAVVEVAPQLALTTETGGRTVSGSELPLSLVVSLMTQYGLNIDIDVIEAGCHVPPGTAYRTVYSQFVGPRHVVGERRTWLVLRLNSFDNLDRIIERGPSRTAGPKALAAAAHRAVQRLQQEQIPAYALSAEDLDTMGDVLLAPVGPADNQEKWSYIRSGPNFITTYVGNPELLAQGQLDRWWSWRTEETMTVIRLTGAGGGAEIQVGVLIRYVHHGKAYKPLAEAKLARPTGIQRQMLDAGIPAGDRALRATMPTIAFSAVRDVRVPIGPSGQILGQLDEGTLAVVPLWDQSGSPKRRRVDARVGVEVARQLVLRAVVTGAVVAIHTDDRQRWDGLVATVNDERRLFYATAGARTSDVAVFDGRTVTTVPTRTVLRLLGPDTASGGADMTIVEGPGQVLEVSIGDADPITVWTIRTREEDRYLGLGHNDIPQPRRMVSTAPVLSRTGRRSAAAAPAPTRRRAPAEPSPAATPPAVAPAAAAPAPSRDRVRANGNAANGNAANGDGGGRHRDLGGPQRIPRSQRSSEPTPPPPPRRPPRDYRPKE